MDAANQKLFGWTEWAYTGVCDVTTSSATGNDEALVYNPALPPTGDNVNTANLTTLAEPYPQVVSGTPGSWSFENGTFQLSYSTAMVDGSGTFAAGSQTTISTSAVEFPTLVIASNGGATTINVTVTGLPSS